MTTTGNRAGLLALFANTAERKTWKAAAAAAGESEYTAWARRVLLDAARRRLCPAPVPPTPLPPVDGLRRRGRQALAPADLRDRQVRIGMTLTERRRVDRAAEAAGMRSTSRWARAVLWSVAPPPAAVEEHRTQCGTCRQRFDMRDLDQVIAHEHDGLHEATGILGTEVRNDD